MLVLKKDGKVYFAESYGNKSEISAKSFISSPANWNVMRAYSGEDKAKMSKKKQRRMILVDSIGHQADALRYVDIFPKTLNEKTLINTTFPALASVFENYRAVFYKDVHSMVFFAEGDKVFVLDPGENCVGVCEEIEEIYSSIPDFDLGGAGIYYAYKDKLDAVSIIRKIYEGASLQNGAICFPVVVMSTGDDEPIIITSDDGRQTGGSN
jgi:hypothetical protein